MAMRIGQTFQHLCPYCKKVKTFTVVAKQSPNRWESQAPSCSDPPGNMMLMVNDEGKQEWPLGPTMARTMGLYIKKHEPHWGVTKALWWLHEACTMPPTKQNIEDYTNAYRE